MAITIVKNGSLVTAHGQSEQDLLIVDGKIAAIEAQIDDSAHPHAQVIDATGLLVMPGGIDVHTHFNIDVGIAKSCDDFFTGTRSAACGGTTTIIDHMGFGPKGCSLHHQLEIYQRNAAGHAVVDYSFHGVIQHIDDSILTEMAELVDLGISSFKLYLTYGYKLNDHDVYQALQQLNKVGALTTVHPENDAAIAIRTEQLMKAGKTTPPYHGESRPLECEAEAISRMINLAKLADDAPLYIVHLSNGLGLEYIELAKQSGQSVWAETCPQYLLLDDSSYRRDDATKFILSPPLRPKAEQQKLWKGLQSGAIDTMATDHCSFNYQQQKQQHHNNFTKCPNGIPGVEVRMPAFYSSGVATGRITPSQFVALTSTNPAKLFGLYPQKGALLLGSDADLIFIDPNAEGVIQHQQLNDNCDYSPYEGLALKGEITKTMLRGTVIAEKGQFTGEAGQGRFIHRQPFKRPNLTE